MRQFCHGGLHGKKVLRPGDTFWLAVVLQAYCILEPGEWRVKMFHDLGLCGTNLQQIPEEGDVELNSLVCPVVEGSVILLEPKAKEDVEVVWDKMLKVPPHPGNTYGERDVNPRAVFEWMRHPVYILISRRAAENGDIRGIETLNGIQVPDSLDHMIELLSSEFSEIRQKAVEVVGQRLKSNTRGLNGDGVIVGVTEKQKEVLQTMMWRVLSDGGEVGIEKIMVNFLDDLVPNVDQSHYVRWVNVMNFQLKRHAGVHSEQHAYPKPPSICHGLLGSAVALFRNCPVLEWTNVSPDDTTDSPAQYLLLGQLGLIDSLEPALISSLIQHPIPYVACVAMETMLEKKGSYLPVDIQNHVIMGFLEREDSPALQHAALTALPYLNNPKTSNAVLKVLIETCEQWTWSTAVTLAGNINIPLDSVAEICIMRLIEDGFHSVVFSTLLSLTVRSNSQGGRTDWIAEAPRMQRAWEVFLRENRDRIRNRELFLPGPPLDVSLFPTGYHVYHEGSPWP